MTLQPYASTESETWISLNDFGEDTSQPLSDPNKYPNMDKLWPRWHAMASCLGNVDDVLFFGAPQDGVYRPSSIKKAQQLCDYCPVFTECLRYALANRESWGIWASTSMRERQAIFDGMDNGHFSLEEIVADREEARDERNRQRADSD